VLKICENCSILKLAGYVISIDIIYPCYLLPVPAGTYAILDPASVDNDQPD